MRLAAIVANGLRRLTVHELLLLGEMSDRRASYDRKRRCARLGDPRPAKGTKMQSVVARTAIALAVAAAGATSVAAPRAADVGTTRATTLVGAAAYGDWTKSAPGVERL